MGYNLSKLQATHREILRLHVNGMSSLDIANTTGMTPTMVSYTINSDFGQLVLEDMQRQLDTEALTVQKQLHENAKASEIFLGGIAQGTTEVPTPLRVKVCMDQLDRAGHAKVTKNVNVDLHGELTEDEIMSIKQDAMALSNIHREEPIECEITTEEPTDGG